MREIEIKVTYVKTHVIEVPDDISKDDLDNLISEKVDSTENRIRNEDWAGTAAYENDNEIYSVG